MSAEWSLCTEGRRQSPIDLSNAAEIDLPAGEIQIPDGEVVELLNQAGVIGPLDNGHTIQVNAKTGEVMTVGDKAYALVQFHFHAPSEHTVDGKFFDLEVHFVHLGPNGDTFSVVGVFFDVQDGGSDENPFVKSVLDALNTGAEANAADRKEAAVREFFNAVDFSEYWSYPGSFTTPPCTEGVRWNVVKDVQSLSSAQLEEFTQYWADDNNFAEGKGSNRAVQPIHSRTLYMSSAKTANNNDEGDDAATHLFAGAAATIAAIAALTF